MSYGVYIWLHSYLSAKSDLQLSANFETDCMEDIAVAALENLGLASARCVWVVPFENAQAPAQFENIVILHR